MDYERQTVERRSGGRNEARPGTPDPVPQLSELSIVGGMDGRLGAKGEYSPIKVDKDGYIRNPHMSDELHQQMKWCTEYYKTHRENIPEGEHVAVVYPIKEIKRFKSYAEASLYISDVDNQTGVFITQHPMEIDNHVAYLAVEGRFDGNPKMAYIDIKVRKRSRRPEEVKEVEVQGVMIDTGASGCFLPESLCYLHDWPGIGNVQRINAADEQYTAAQLINVEISV